MAIERDEFLWLHREARVTLAEIAEGCGLPAQAVRELVDLGVLAPLDEGDVFAADALARVRRAARLGRDFELETSALALLVSFLERIDALEAEVRNLDAQLQFPRRLR